MTVLLGIVLGVVVAGLFLGSTPVLLTPLVRASAKASPATALLFFGAKAVAATGALVLLFDVGNVSDHVDLTAFGVAVAVTAVACTALMIMRFRRRRTPTYDLGNDAL